MDFAAMAELCAPEVASGTLKNIAIVESRLNPFAIGVVGGRLQRQPQNLAEALATSQMLKSQGYNYSLGLVQVNQSNFARYGMTHETAFDPCVNLRVGSLIFKDCYDRAGRGDRRLGDALSCYYSGNFVTGYSHGYVAKVLAAGGDVTLPVGPIPVAPTRKPAAVRNKVAAVQAAGEGIFITSSPTPKADSLVAPDISTPTKSKDTALLF